MIYPEKPKSDVYAKFIDVSKPQYSELPLQYQNTKSVYTDLSTDNQRYVEEPFYRKVDETDRGTLPQPPDVIYDTVEEEILPYEENSYYSALETLPHELANP